MPTDSAITKAVWTDVVTQIRPYKWSDKLLPRLGLWIPEPETTVLASRYIRLTHLENLSELMSNMTDQIMLYMFDEVKERIWQKK